MDMRALKPLYCALTMCALSTACDSGCEPESQPPDSSPDAGEEMYTPGPRPDQGLVMLDGEECAFSAVSPVSSTTSYLSVQITDLTAQGPIAELDDSIAPTFRFDAPEGHTVEVELGGKSEVFPTLTHSFTVDTRCRVLDDRTYYIPTGYKVVGQLATVGSSIDEDVRQLHDARVNHLYLHHAQAGWLGITASEEPAPAKLLDAALPADFVQASADAVLHFPRASRPDQDRFATLIDGAVVLSLEIAKGGVSQLARHDVEGAALGVHTVQGATWLHDEGGVIWLVLEGGEVASAQSNVRSLAGASSSHGFVLGEGGEIGRVTRAESSRQLTIEPLGSIPDAQKIIPSGGGDQILLVLRSDEGSCAMFEDRCTAELRHARDLSPVLDEQGEPHIFEDIIAAHGVPGGVLALRQLESEVEMVRIFATGEVSITRHDELRGAPDAQRSITLPDGFALGMRQRVAIARFGEEQVIGDEGRYRPSLDSLGRLELRADPCEELSSCERILWRLGDLSSGRLHTSFVLGQGLDVEVTQEGEFDEVVFTRGMERADVARGASVRLSAQAPFGAPCLPAIVSTVAIDRFSPMQEGLFCLGWHEL